MSGPRHTRCEPIHPPHALGAWGERYAAIRLEREGWTILERGYRLEVKTRSDTRYGEPEEAVTWAKRREIEAVALDYLLRREPGDIQVRFDVIAIVAGPGREVLRYLHIEDAWRPAPPR